MKSKLLRILSMLLVLSMVLALAPVTVLAADDTLGSVTLSAPSKTVAVGKTLSLTASASNTDGETYSGSADFAYTSTNEYVATVDSTGLVTGKHEGSVTILVTATSGSISVSDTCEVQVITEVNPVDFEDMTVGSAPTGFTAQNVTVGMEGSNNRTSPWQPTAL